VDPPGDKLPKLHKGVRTGQGGVGVVLAGWGGRTVRQEELFRSHFEPPVGANDWGDRGKIIC